MEKRLREACSLSWFEAAQGRLPTIAPFDTAVNLRHGLTKSLLATMF
jgi:hypothetical protein